MLKASVGHLDSSSVPTDNSKQTANSSKRGDFRRSAARAVLVAGLLITVVSALSWHSSVLDDNRQAFESSAGDVASNLDTLLQRDADLVAAARAYYETNPGTTARQFRDWIDRLGAAEKYAGLDRIGLVERVPAAELSDFKRRALADTAGQTTRFSIQPPGNREFYCLTTTHASGASTFEMRPGTYFDYCQPGVYGQARLGLQQSVDRGKNGMMPSFGEVINFYSPIYAGGKVPRTVAERRRNAIGWASGFFHTDQVVKAAVGNRRLGVRMFQKGREGRKNLVTAGGRPPNDPTLFHTIAIPGDDGLSVEIAGIPEVHGLSARAQAAVVAAAGLTLVGVLFLLIQTLTRARERALALVERRTRELRHSEARLASIAKSSPTGIIQVDHDGTLKFANERFHELLQPDGEHLTGNDWIERFDVADRERLRVALRDADEQDAELELHVTRPESGWLRVSVAPIASADEKCHDDGVVASLEDVTLAHNARERLRYEARHDLLTGLVNRTRFLEQLQDSLDALSADGDEFTVLYLDLDRFKPVNDVLGHAAGDELLQLVAQRLQSVLRENDALARHGGDEFTILLRGYKDRDAVEAVVGRLVDTIAKPFAVNNGETVAVGVSVGVVHVNDNERTPADILRDADIAMYRAKQGTRGFEVFDDADRQVYVSQLETERELRAAIENDELELYFQPSVHLSTGEIAGAEALIRWNHPTRGLLGPYEFLPMAEETGLIVPVGEWVIDSAARFLSERPKDLKISINVAARQLLAEGFIDRLCEITGTHEIDRARLVIEIIESDRLVGEALDVATEVRKRGFRIGIDDFGTGYNSLLYLKTYALDFVKIDRAFVSDLGKSKAADEVFRKVVGLSHALDLFVVAEGVETQEQADVVIAGGCDIGQGFLWAKPMSADAFDAFKSVFKARPAEDSSAPKLHAV